MGNIQTAPSPKPERDTRHPAARYFDRLRAAGHDMDRYAGVLRDPERTHLFTMETICRREGLELIDLLRAGIGVNNSYQDIDQAISRTGSGYTLDVVQNVA